MKKTIAIILLALFLFNLWGYSLLFQYYIQRSDKQLSERISKNQYRPDDLVEIKIPVHLPDIYNYDVYEPANGQVQLKHNCYNYVKLKITRDTLFLMCVPNAEKTRLIDASTIYAKEVSDLPLTKKAHSSTLVKALALSKYDRQTKLSHFTPGFSIIKKINSNFSFLLDHPFIAADGPPPEAIS